MFPEPVNVKGVGNHGLGQVRIPLELEIELMSPETWVAWRGQNEVCNRPPEGKFQYANEPHLPWRLTPTG